MPRTIWKGAISFGLVHVPVALVPASQETGIDFDWLDKRSMDPVGYKRVNKRTGKEIDKAHIVKGIKQDDGDYVVISEDEIRAAYPQSTQTIDIEQFVQASEVPFTYLEKPYFLTPLGKGAKVYALLREAMRDAGVIGIARVVMHTKETLAALVPDGPALMLNTIRWANELRSSEELSFPPAGKSAAGLKDAEMKMARELISGMTSPFEPAQYSETFADAIRALAARKVEAGDTQSVEPVEAEPSGETTRSSNVVDLTELLRRSLGKRQAGGKAKGTADDAADDTSADEHAAPKKAAPAKKAAAKKAPAKKAAAKPTAPAARKRA
jgi:DNA end-binding protein Ku